MRFGELQKHQGPALVISPRHEAWLPENGNPTYSAEALNFGYAELLKQSTPRDRRGSVSASGLGKCLRKQQFTFLGLPELLPAPRTAQIFQNGTFMHVRWQMAGITEGWLPKPEVPIYANSNEHMLSGTLDGLLYEGSVLELKSANDNNYKRVVTFGALYDHVFQMGAYLLCTGAEKGVFLYENKNDQEYKEIVVRREDAELPKVAERAEEVWTAITDERLAEPLDKCCAGEGYIYTSCPFKDRCLGIKSWEHAKEFA